MEVTLFICNSRHENCTAGHCLCSLLTGFLGDAGVHWVGGGKRATGRHPAGGGLTVALSFPLDCRQLILAEGCCCCCCGSVLNPSQTAGSLSEIVLQSSFASLISSGTSAVGQNISHLDQNSYTVTINLY